MKRVFSFIRPAAMLVGLAISSAAAQEKPVVEIGIPEEIAHKVRIAQDALEEVQGVLETENLYVPAVDGLNPAAIMAGGLNALEDLNGEGGVDPFTFVGLYEGHAIDEVREFIERDPESDRLKYKDRIVRLYPLAKLKTLYHQELGVQPVAAPAPLSADLLSRMTVLKNALDEAQNAMEIGKQYVPAVKGYNPYAVMIGGLDARVDLARGPDVDPITFIGLYAGAAVDDVKEKLGKDEFGRRTYDGRLIRFYSITRLKQLDARRILIQNAEER